ncbi:hypothetical protein M6B38_182420 [Iris pallida]|uniref:Uncharacterized protein n=1 Tax=Iris pallida TaxID=29817 RepID=A0AAX6ELD5_IRIPA|nr:hypothetical protein M6B38_182420 [Iris pallida]
MGIITIVMFSTMTILHPVRLQRTQIGTHHCALTLIYFFAWWEESGV